MKAIHTEVGIAARALKVWDNGALAHRRLLRHPVNRQWKGYWQRGP
jgi:hypothetical protein